MNKPLEKLNKRDFNSGQEVRWCPACGDFAILKALREVLVERGENPKNLACISGIGCAGRMPHYLAGFGFHGVHGRAPAIATGVKLANPVLSVWVVTGDGDGLSIGAGHLAHALRRNIDINILLINNQVYGLTKGQISPTSPRGMSAPGNRAGTQHQPMSAAAFAMGAGGRFFARAIDRDRAGLKNCLHRASEYRGAAIVEILQNCVIYHDGAFADIAARAPRLKQGQPMALGVTTHLTAEGSNPGHAATQSDAGAGAEGTQGLVYDPEKGEWQVTTSGPFTTHDEGNPGKARLLAGLMDPLPLGVLWARTR